MKKNKKNIFRCPRCLDIYNSRNYSETLNFIYSLDKIIECNLSDVIISFIQTREIKAAAMILLYSKLENIFKYTKVKVTLLTGANIAINSFLKRTGVFYLCKHYESNNDFSCSKLPIISGKSGEFREEIIDFIKEQIYKNNFDDTLEYVYGDAIQEAINNVSLHAYPDLEEDERKWWLYCTLIDDELYLVLYDQGKGIPNTFTKGNKAFDEVNWDDIDLKQEIERLMNKWGIDVPMIDSQAISNVKSSDSSKIFFAMADDITRMTGYDELKHGQGSKSIKKLVSSHKEGILWIFSNCGLYRYINDDSAPLLRDYHLSIKGTLIQWNIKVFK